MSDRVTLDLGYQFFALTPGRSAHALSNSVSSYALPAGSFPSVFNASELLLSVRIDEPFRGLIR